jgi:hypothetical protein
MTPDRQNWLMLLGAQLRKRLDTEALPPESPFAGAAMRASQIDWLIV